jgi:hypothetical protein
LSAELRAGFTRSPSPFSLFFSFIFAYTSSPNPCSLKASAIPSSTSSLNHPHLRFLSWWVRLEPLFRLVPAACQTVAEIAVFENAGEVGPFRPWRHHAGSDPASLLPPPIF